MTSPPSTRAIALVHGQPGAGSDWNPVIARLAGSPRIHAVDRPGYRSSLLPAAGLVANAQQLLADLDTAGLVRPLLVGHSYGGGIAITAAALEPDRFSGLVLIASVGPNCLDGWDRLLAAPVTGTVCALAAWWLTPWAARAGLAGIERRRGRPLGPDEYLNWECWANARHPTGAMWRTFLTEQRDLVRTLPELSARAGTLRLPTLIIADPADGMIPVATSHELHRLIRPSELQLVESGGHSLPRRRPALIAGSISDFLAGLDR
ncbi:MAG: alpha/beta hydrolase [Jatrophihabitantaceae bacterium]